MDVYLANLDEIAIVRLENNKLCPFCDIGHRAFHMVQIDHGKILDHFGKLSVVTVFFNWH